MFLSDANNPNLESRREVSICGREFTFRIKLKREPVLSLILWIQCSNVETEYILRAFTAALNGRPPTHICVYFFFLDPILLKFPKPTPKPLPQPQNQSCKRLSCSHLLHSSIIKLCKLLKISSLLGDLQHKCGREMQFFLSCIQIWRQLESKKRYFGRR